MRHELRHRQQTSSKLPRPASGKSEASIEATIEEIQDLMWKEVGIVRTADGLRRAIEHLERIHPKVAHPHAGREYEARNLQIAGSLVARSALAREESRGAHYRTDFPDHDDARFLKHSVVSGSSIRFGPQPS
jgi:L-aspartate oxidase